MLAQTLTSINKVLDNLIYITNEDIKDIQAANHNPLFDRNLQKERLIQQFANLKTQIDNTLVQRSQKGLSLENMLNPQEDKLFEEFKIKLQEFYNLHKKFSKMALIIANFYNNLANKVNGNEVDIGYQMNKKQNPYSTFSLKA